MAMSSPIHQRINALENVVRPERASKDVKDNTVLSFSFEKDLLPRREAALRGVGYTVFSTTSEACIDFEKNGPVRRAVTLLHNPGRDPS